MATKIEPLNDNVYIEPTALKEEVTSSGLVLAKKEGANGLRPGRGVVLGVGPKATGVVVGDEVLYFLEFAQFVEIDLKRYAVVRSEHLTAKVRS